MTTLGPSLTVVGEITCQEDITIHGKVKGDIVASERLELTDTAVVTGMISAPSLVIRDGATFDGVIDMAAKKKGETPAAPKLAIVEPVAKAS